MKIISVWKKYLKNEENYLSMYVLLKGETFKYKRNTA